MKMGRPLSQLAAVFVPASFLGMLATLLFLVLPPGAPRFCDGPASVNLNLSAALSQAFAAKRQDMDSIPICSTPVNLGPSINTAANEFHFAISKDGRTAFFASDRPGGFGGEDIWYTQRATRHSPWGPAHHFGPNINTDTNEASPLLSPDEHWLFFSSRGKPGGKTGFGGADIWAVHRRNVHDPAEFDREAPINLGPNINTQFNDVDPTLFEDPETGTVTMYFASNRTPGCLTPNNPENCLDIYRSTLGPASDCSLSRLGVDCFFGPAVLVRELSSPKRDAHPTIRADGLVIILTSNRTGSIGGSLDLWVSTWDSALGVWRDPLNLGPTINTIYNERAPYLSVSGRTLYFTSDRPGGFGGDDFYMTKCSEVEEDDE